jgi:hypothetical protein
VLLLRVVVRGQAEDGRAGLGTNHVLDYAAELTQAVDVVFGGQVVDVAPVLEPHHPALEHGESERVGDRGLLEGDLRPVGEARDHVGVLTPLAGELLLGGRVAVLVLEALDVAHEQRRQAEAPHVTEQVPLHTGLIAVARRVHQSRLVGVRLEQRSERPVELGVHHHDVLAVVDGVRDDACGEVDRARDLEHHVDAFGAAQHRGVVGHRRRAARDRLLERSRRLDDRGLGGPRPPRTRGARTPGAGWRSPRAPCLARN